MASYDNLMAIEQQPWMIRPEIYSPWIPDAFAKENTGGATSLATSFHTSSFAAASDSSYGSSYVFPDELLESIFAAKPDAMSIQTPSSASTGSEKDAAGVSPTVSKQRRPRSVVPLPTGKVAKRKSRAKKRTSMTTFITADPANFRQMVQQVTGARFGLPDEEGAAAAWNPVSVNPLESGCGLPTLDTSSVFLMDGSVSQNSAGGVAAAAEQYVGSFCSFPTLESWTAT